MGNEIRKINQEIVFFENEIDNNYNTKMCTDTDIKVSEFLAKHESFFKEADLLLCRKIAPHIHSLKKRLNPENYPKSIEKINNMLLSNPLLITSIDHMPNEMLRYILRTIHDGPLISLLKYSTVNTVWHKCIIDVLKYTIKNNSGDLVSIGIKDISEITSALNILKDVEAINLRSLLLVTPRTLAEPRFCNSTYAFMDYSDDELSKPDIDEETDALIPCLTQNPNLHSLDLSGWPLTLEELTMLCQKNLSALGLAHCPGITDAHIEQIITMPNLNALDLSGCIDITPEGLQKLTHLPLTELRLSGCCQLNDEVLSQFKLAQLKVLDISGCDQVSDDGLSSILQASHLIELNISGCSKLSSTFISSILKLSSLQELNISSLSVNGMIIDSKNLSPLTVLIARSCLGMNDDVLRQFRAIRGLQCLDLSHSTKITNAGIRATLEGLIHLERIKLNHCQGVDKPLLQYIVGRENLRALGLQGCRITSNENAGFAQLTRLKLLDLGNCDWLTEEDLEQITSMHTLSHLNLSNVTSAFNTETIAKLFRKNSLVYLNLSGILDFIEEEPFPPPNLRFIC